MTQEEIALTHQQLRERLLTWILIGSLDRETAMPIPFTTPRASEFVSCQLQQLVWCNWFYDCLKETPKR